MRVNVDISNLDAARYETADIRASRYRRILDAMADEATDAGAFKKVAELITADELFEAIDAYCTAGIKGR